MPHRPFFVPSAINSLIGAFAENLANRLEVRFSPILLALHFRCFIPVARSRQVFTLLLPSSHFRISFTSVHLNQC